MQFTKNHTNNRKLLLNYFTPKQYVQRYAQTHDNNESIISFLNSQLGLKYVRYDLKRLFKPFKKTLIERICIMVVPANIAKKYLQLIADNRDFFGRKLITELVGWIISSTWNMKRYSIVKDYDYLYNFFIPLFFNYGEFLNFRDGVRMKNKYIGGKISEKAETFIFKGAVGDEEINTFLVLFQEGCLVAGEKTNVTRFFEIMVRLNLDCQSIVLSTFRQDLQHSHKIVGTVPVKYLKINS